MTPWTRLTVQPPVTIREAIAAIDAGGMQIVFVVDEAGRLLGTVSDGDVRRAILRGVSLESPATEIMNPQPLVARPDGDRDLLIANMRASQIHRVPVVDAEGRMIGLEVFDKLLRPALRDNVVVLMAGGRGTRLQPLTNERPKPMLMVGDRPILETILLNFIEHGFHRFYISVNYKADMVKEHFGTGSRWGIDISYLEETSEMGTAGCLTLLPEAPVQPILVMNGDLLTRVNFQVLIDFHQSHGAEATMCVREYDFQVPYGVVKLDRDRFVGIEEKPVSRFFVSAGIYVLEPPALRLIPRNARFDMPDLFNELVNSRRDTVVFPVREYWLDIGRHADLEKAAADFMSWSR
jgi:dTDP-glucose pyrophosphorylase